MKELLDYERVLWALARELYERNRVLGAPLWALATPAVKANFRTKADHCLNGWGYENVEDTLSTRTYPADVYHRATHDAQDLYLKSLIEKYEEEPPTMQRASHRKTNFDDAVEALAKYAYECSISTVSPSWNVVPDHDKTAYRSIANTLLSARGFVPIEGSLQLTEGNGPIFTTVAHVLRDGFALNRVEALVHNDITAFKKYNMCMLLDEYTPEKKVTLTTRALANDKLSEGPGPAKTEDPYPDGSYERCRDAVPEPVNPYPVNEDGAEDYRAVQASASVLHDAIHVMGRDLYEKAVVYCTNSTPWRDLLPVHQNYYYEQAKTLPLNLVELREVFNKQQEDDAKIDKIDKEVKPAPSFVPVASVLREPTPMSGVQGVGGMIAAARSIGSRQDTKPDTKCETKAEAADNYGLLAETAYALLCVHIPYDPWKNLKWFAKRTLKGIAEDAWLMRNPVLDVRPDVNFFWTIVNELREFALSRGMTLNQLLDTDEMRAVREGTKYTLPGTANNYETLPVHIPSPTGGLILPETTALAWYAHETSRMDNNALLPWCELSGRAQYVKMHAARDYFVHNKRDPSQSEPFYAALDAVPRNAVSYLCIAYHELRHLNTNPYVLRFLFDK